MASVVSALKNGERLSALLDSHLLQYDGCTEGLDRITELACRLLKVETCCISAIDATTQVYKNYRGLGAGRVTGIPIRNSICQHVVAQGEGVIIDDTGQHLLTRYNGALRESKIRAYLGMPLMKSGKAIGTICVADDKPRAWTAEDAETLRNLAHCVMLEIKLTPMGLSLAT